MQMSEEAMYEIRRRNARILARRLGGQKALAEAIDRDPSQVSSVIGKKPRDNIGNKLASLIEEACGVESGWLDSGEEYAPSQHSDVMSDVDFMTMVIEEVNKQASVVPPDITPRKLAVILYNTSLLRDRHEDLSAEQIRPHIQALLSLALG